VTLTRPDRAFFLVATAFALAYVLLPRDGALYGRWYQLFSIAAVAATLVGVMINRPASRTPWYLVAASGLGAIAADAVHAIDLDRDGTVPFPSAADFIALGSYVVLVAALVLMIRQQTPGRDLASLVDAGIVTVGVAIVGWTFVVQPNLTLDSGALETVIALAFPVLDVLLVSLAVHMLLGAGFRSPAFAMVTTALVFQLVGDGLYGFGSLHGWYRAGDPVDILFVFAAVLWGTAALHPSMVELTRPNADPEMRLTGKRLAVLSGATLMAPVMLAVGALRAGSNDLLVIVAAATMLSALVIVRLAGLVARHERAEKREHALAEAAASLVVAWTPEDIQRVAVDSALEIVGEEGTTVALALGSDDEARMVAAAGALRNPVLARGRKAIANGQGTWSVVQLVVQGDPRGAISVHTRESLQRSARDGLETLAAQVALALEGATLAVDLHERQSAERFRSLVQSSSDVIALLASDLTIRYHTPSVERVLGYGEDELVGKHLTELLEPAEAERLGSFFANVQAAPATPMPSDLRLIRKDGSVGQLESVFNNLLEDANVAGIVVTARDVTERRMLEAELAHQAFHDPLTGLANRALFADRVGHARDRGVRRETLFAVFFIDLDDFKTVNDSLGHAAGDELLVTVASRLETCLRPEDTCARLGGDEFALMVEDIAGPDAAVAVAERVLGALVEPMPGSEVPVQASIGIALGTGEQSTSEILRSADLAMYRAKEDGKSRYALYESSMHEQVLERLELKADLGRSVVAEEFEIYYQPIVALKTGAIVGLEALVRWRHPARGIVNPEVFVPLAEETGLILPLGRFVLHGACRDLKWWNERGHPELGVNVNISAKQLGSSSLPADVRAALTQSSLDPSKLTLEITESVLLDSEEVIARLQGLKRLGVRIAIDDFGTGYSSLNYLRRYPVDTLKIAKPFVDEIGSSPAQERLAAAILGLGLNLGLDTVAEGIETGAQRDRLRALHCRYGQGFFFSPPMSAAEVQTFLRSSLVA